MDAVVEEAVAPAPPLVLVLVVVLVVLPGRLRLSMISSCVRWELEPPVVSSSLFGVWLPVVPELVVSAANRF